jgi:hypothetical protein
MPTLRSLPLIGAVVQVVHSTDVLEKFMELPPPLHARDQLGHLGSGMATGRLWSRILLAPQADPRG